VKEERIWLLQAWRAYDSQIIPETGPENNWTV
jgi:hypothetical protein